ncbi:hypothetical protein [Mycolicibacterium fortuitum]|uniref:hypothetical protein n=1 Tax=Mycolicibacterium fortuitum TaxID=1766 RepID=UPI001131FC8C|nr:hypothetical protein [Mycolicibacterium fortuitum]TPW95722.1 hypothetical protein FKW78_10245 [Mycolicibacterium fortuitum]
MSITDAEAIERAVELGFLAGADRHRAIANVTADRIRERVRERITAVIAAFDAHDPGIYRASDSGKPHDLYRCGMGCAQAPESPFLGTREEWERHLADKLADALAGA